MGDTQNLTGEEAIKKIKELAVDIGVCMFCTNLGNSPFETRPMGTQDVDEQGNLWFFSDKASNKNVEIKQDDKVQLIYSKQSDAHFLSIYGRADIFYDRAKVEELWSPLVKAWFTKGKDDPNLSLIRVRPEQAYYWDTKDGKMISLVKIAAAAVTGKTMDGGIEGEIKI